MGEFDGAAAPACGTTAPEALVYEPAPDGTLVLVGVEYVVFKQAWHAANPVPPELFGLARADPTSPVLGGLRTGTRIGRRPVRRACGRLGDVDAAAIDAKLNGLRAELRRLGRVVVAFSGGADSALLASVANQALGPDAALAVTAVSPSLAGVELDDCRRLSAEWGMRWQPLATDELERAAYRVNDLDRCYHCKSALMDALAPVATAERATVVLGVNTDDLADHRPGQRAALEAGAAFPLVAAGFSKQDVRDASRSLGLRTWDKPAAACLASRIPTGTAVTVDLLSRVDRAEAAIRALGFRQLRVRHHGETARIEVDAGDLALAVARREEIVEALHALGYRYVTLDLEGFRSGSTNGAPK